MVLASACEVYGDAGADGRPLGEATPPQPITTFGSLKRAAETIADTFYRDYRLNVTIARPFHYTGPGQSDRFFFGAVARRLAEWDPAADGSELHLPDLSCRRELLHVEDVVAAYERLLADGRPNETYNICSGQAQTCREIVEAMIGELGRDIRLSEVAAGDGDVQIPVLRGDNTKIRDELNWAPTRSAQDAVRDLLASCGAPAAALAT